MKKRTLSVGLFRILDQIASEDRITDGQWAEASGLKFHSRIAEFRQIGRGKNNIGRAWTISKFQQLAGGLIYLMGKDTYGKRLLSKLDKAKSEEEKINLLATILSDDSKQRAREYMEMLAKTQAKK